MTPPDSGDKHECRCGYRIVGRDAEGPHTWSECKPASGEREETERNADPDTLFSIRRGLAQRILAALENPESPGEVADVAAELRAAVERKP